jgi:hypothetical protein
MLFKILNQSLYLCDIAGNLGRRISENVAFGTYDETHKIFLITSLDGKLETKDVAGNPIRVLSQGVLEARFLGNDILVRKRDGKNVLIDKSGNIRRYI